MPRWVERSKSTSLARSLSSPLLVSRGLKAGLRHPPPCASAVQLTACSRCLLWLPPQHDVRSSRRVSVASRALRLSSTAQHPVRAQLLYSVARAAATCVCVYVCVLARTPGPFIGDQRRSASVFHFLIHSAFCSFDGQGSSVSACTEGTVARLSHPATSSLLPLSHSCCRRIAPPLSFAHLFCRWCRRGPHRLYAGLLDPFIFVWLRRRCAFPHAAPPSPSARLLSLCAFVLFLSTFQRASGPSRRLGSPLTRAASRSASSSLDPFVFHVREREASSTRLLASLASSANRYLGLAAHHRDDLRDSPGRPPPPHRAELAHTCSPLFPAPRYSSCRPLSLRPASMSSVSACPSVAAPPAPARPAPSPPRRTRPSPKTSPPPLPRVR